MISIYSLPLYLRHWKEFFFGKKPFWLRISGLMVLVRPKTYDLYTISEVFDGLVYKPSLRDINSNFKIVLDLGAGIGDFSLWAYKFLHTEKTIAVEMESGNFRSLCLNIKRNGLEKIIVPLNIAIAENEGEAHIKINDFNSGMHSLDFKQKKGIKVKTIGLKELLEIYKINKVDLLKMDIEGAEQFVLNENNKVLFSDKVGYLIIESHADHKRNAAYFANLGFEVKTMRQLFNRAVIIEALNKTLIKLN